MSYCLHREKSLLVEVLWMSPCLQVNLFLFSRKKGFLFQQEQSIGYEAAQST